MITIDYLINPNDYSKLYINDRVGYTGYIDIINYKELKDNVMTGYDIYNRPFITLKGTVITETNKYPFAQTFFRRYSDNELLWMGCHIIGRTELIRTSGGMTQYQHNFLRDLIINKTVDLRLENIDELRLYDDNINLIKLD